MTEPDGAAPTALPTRRSVRRAVVLTYGASIGVAALSLVNVVITSRSLGPEGRGSLAFLTTIAMLTSQLSSLGVEESIGNLAGGRPALRPSIATNGLVLAGALGALAASLVGAIVIVFPAVGGGSEPELLTLALCAIPILVLQLYLQFLIRADYGFAITNAVSLLGPALNVVVNGSLALFGVLSVGAALVTWIVGQLICTGLLALYVGRSLTGFGRVNRPLSGAMVGFGLKAHVGRVMKTGNYRLDQWLLGAIAGPTELGLYSVAVAWTEALFFLPEALATVLRPDLVRDSEADAGRRAAMGFRLALFLTGVLAAAFVVAAPLLCVVVFGEAFRGSIDDLRLLAPGALGIVALKILGNALVAQGRPLLSNAAVAVAFLVTVALDLVLIPHHGGLGAAIASTVAYTMGGIAVAVIFARTLGIGLRELLPGRRELQVLADRVR